MKILVAEDDSVSRLVLARTLEKLGHEVAEARDGTEAWDAFQKDHVPLLISDWMMPDMDGLELCRKIRAEGRAKYTYIVLLTALGGKENYMEGMNAGADDFITKPFDEDQLATRLRVAERILSLQTEVRQLRGFLPICCYCKKIRDDQDYWHQIERYLAEHLETELSHGICPECYENVVKPELEELKRRRQPAQ